MVQTIGESREAWGLDVMKMAESFANGLSKEREPFWIVYACKEDRGMSNKLGRSAFKQAFKAWPIKPMKDGKPLLAVLVWYVDHSKGTFDFCPELSSPPDVPLDERLLSDKASDASERVMAQGEKVSAIVS